jgi:hypothetical protein
LFLLSACANANATDGGAMIPSSGSSSSAVPSASDELVLRVATGGGFAGNRGQIGKIPQVSIYGDGRVLSQAPEPAIYPGPAMSSVQVQIAPPATVDELIATGQALLATGTDAGRPGLADGTTTTITVKGKTISVYALNEAQANDPAFSPAQRTLRSGLAAFAEKLTQLPTAAGMPAAQPYEPTAVAVLANPFTQPADGLPSKPAAQPWPGPALPGAYLNEGAKQGCFIASGETLKKVLPVAQTAKQNTPWTSGPATWSVKFRPMLPDETGCGDLWGAR